MLKLPVIDGAAAADALLDHRRRVDGVVEHDRQAAADVGGGDLLEQAGAARVEIERHDVRLLRAGRPGAPARRRRRRRSSASCDSTSSGSPCLRSPDAVALLSRTAPRCRPAAAASPFAYGSGLTSRTSLNSSTAVLPIRSLARSGPGCPGSWIEDVAASPWRWMIGSLTPNWSMRLRIVSSDWSTADCLMRLHFLGQQHQRCTMLPSTVSAVVELEVGELPGRRSRPASRARRPAIGHCQRGVRRRARPWRDLHAGLAQLAPQLLGVDLERVHHRLVDVDRQHQVRAALQVEAERHLVAVQVAQPAGQRLPRTSAAGTAPPRWSAPTTSRVRYMRLLLLT